MVEPKQLNKLKKAELLEMADIEGLQAKLSTPVTDDDTKETIVNALAEVAEPEMVSNRLGTTTVADVKVNEDPAVAPPVTDETDDYQISVNDKVTYPYKGATGGRRTGRVRATNGSLATVTYADGGERQFSVAMLKKVK